MSVYSGDYKNFWLSDNGTKYSYCSKAACTHSIEKWSIIEVCENKHIFHEKCWKGVCTDSDCKAIKEAIKLEIKADWERGAPERERLADERSTAEAKFALIAGTVLIGLIFLFSSFKWIR